MGNISLKFPTKSSYPYFKRKDYIPSWNFKWLLSFKSEKCFFSNSSQHTSITGSYIPLSYILLRHGCSSWVICPQWRGTYINSSPPVQNSRHFADVIFKCIFIHEKFCILIWIPLKFVLKGSVDYKSALVQVMAWNQTDNKPLSELMLTQFTDTYIWHKGRWVKLTLTLLRMHICQFRLHHSIQNIPQILFHWVFIPEINKQYIVS